MLFTNKSLMCVLSALVFGVGISYGQSEQILRKDNEKGTTVILVDPNIYINKVTIHQRSEDQGETVAPQKSQPLPVRDTVYIQKQDTFIINQPELIVVLDTGTVVEPQQPETKRSREERQLWVAVKSNVLLDCGYIPQYGFAPIWNAALEYYPKGGRWSFGASLDIPWWEKPSEHKFVELRNWQVEGRRYFWSEPGEYRRMYLQAYAHLCTFNIGFSETKGWQGEGMGAGLGIGYVWSITQRWRLEAGLQAGILVAKYDPYVYGDPIDHVDNGYYYYDWEGKEEDFKRRNYRYTWLGPTRVGITITYNLFLRPRQKGEVR